MVDVSVILVSYNTIEMTKKALNHLFDSIHSSNMEVFVVDNNSRDHSANILRQEYRNITLIENKENVGFGRANNQVVPYIKSRYVLLLNTDAFIEPETIAKTVQYMDDNPKCGILGVKFLGHDGALQPSCRFFPTPWNNFLNGTGLDRIFKHARMVDDMSWDHASVKNCDWVPGCYFLIRKKVIDQVGLFDPRYFLYYEEIDHCFAAKKAGWEITYYPYTSVVHLGGESAKTQGEITSSGRQLEHLQIESELLFFRKNYGFNSVLLNMFLITLSDSIFILKDILKSRRQKICCIHLKHSFLVWRLFFKTKMGIRPTR